MKCNNTWLWCYPDLLCPLHTLTLAAISWALANTSALSPGGPPSTVTWGEKVGPENSDASRLISACCGAHASSLRPHRAHASELVAKLMELLPLRHWCEIPSWASASAVHQHRPAASGHNPHGGTLLRSLSWGMLQHMCNTLEARAGRDAQGALADDFLDN